ncbi:hypothetical protein Aperf_G00000015758 [Anoplocephala perfoliata]
MAPKRNRSSTQSSKSNGSVAAPEKNLFSKKHKPIEGSKNKTEKTEDETQHIKKIKRMLVDEGDSSDDAEETVEDSDEDIGDDESETDESEDDGSENGASDDEEGSEADSDHDGDTEDESPDKAVIPKESKANKKERHQSPMKVVADEKKPVEKKSQVSSRILEPFKPSQSNVMLFNIPHINEVELKGFLSKRNVHPESISCINNPVVLLGFSNETVAKKAMNACSGVTYSQSVIAAVSASGDGLALIKSNRNPHPGKDDAPLTCVFVTEIPKNVKQEELIGVTGIEPKHIRFITTGEKNRTGNACFIDCKSEVDAQRALQALSAHHFDGRTVKLFLKPQFNFRPITENSVLIANVPFSADIDTIKKEFPEAKKVELTRRGCFMLFFENSVVRDKVVKEAQGKTLEGRQLRFITTDKAQADVAVFVSNVAYNTRYADLKAVFPGCKSVFMNKKNGKFTGSAVVYFESKEEAESAVKSAANKEINGRLLNVSMSDEEPKAASGRLKKEAKANMPGTTENKSKKNIGDPVQVGSESEQGGDSVEDDSEDDAEVTKGSSDDGGEAEDDDDSEDDAEITKDSTDDGGEDGEEEGDSNDDTDGSEEYKPPEKKRSKVDEYRTSDSRPFFKQRGGRGGDFRGGNRGRGFRGGNRGGGFRGGNRGGGFRGGNRGRGRDFRGGRGRGVSKT